MKTPDFSDITVEIIKFDECQTDGRVSNPRLYIWMEDEGVMDHLFNRHFEPVELYRQRVLPLIQVKFERLLGKKVSFRWSWKAGCKCGCSPGFIVVGTPPMYKNYHATVRFNGMEKHLLPKEVKDGLTTILKD